MGAKEITVAGIWTFVIIALVGGLYGEVDGVALLIFFIVAVGVSLGIMVMPTPGQSPKGVEKSEVESQ